MRAGRIDVGAAIILGGYAARVIRVTRPADGRASTHRQTILTVEYADGTQRTAGFYDADQIDTVDEYQARVRALRDRPAR